MLRDQFLTLLLYQYEIMQPWWEIDLEREKRAHSFLIGQERDRRFPQFSDWSTGDDIQGDDVSYRWCELKDFRMPSARFSRFEKAWPACIYTTQTTTRWVGWIARTTRWPTCWQWSSTSSKTIGMSSSLTPNVRETIHSVSAPTGLSSQQG